MNYTELSKEDFDAVVTGELTHYAIWHESALEGFITNFFCFPQRSTLFTQLLMRRDGFTSQNKIEVIRSIIDILQIDDTKKKSWYATLKRIEDFKSFRNAFAHGLDITPFPYVGNLSIEIISRSGKEKKIEITQESYLILLQEGEETLKSIQNLCEDI